MRPKRPGRLNYHFFFSVLSASSVVKSSSPFYFFSFSTSLYNFSILFLIFSASSA
jgi:hypothetical protein